MDYAFLIVISFQITKLKLLLNCCLLAGRNTMSVFMPVYFCKSYFHLYHRNIVIITPCFTPAVNTDLLLQITFTEQN